MDDRLANFVAPHLCLHAAVSRARASRPRLDAQFLLRDDTVVVGKYWNCAQQGLWTISSKTDSGYLQNSATHAKKN